MIKITKVKVAKIKDVRIIAHYQSKGPKTNRITIPQQTMKDNEFLNNDSHYDIVIYQERFTNEINRESRVEGDEANEI